MYLGFEGNDFEHHLNGEEASEDHVEDVHGIVKGSSLLIVLWGDQMGTEPKAETPYTQTHSPWLELRSLGTWKHCLHCLSLWTLQSLVLDSQTAMVGSFCEKKIYFIKICKSYCLVQLFLSLFFSLP